MTFKKLILAGALIAAPFLITNPAEAREYCREYTKSIRVGGQLQSGYGTACQQQDGSWMIVSSSGTVDPFDELRRQNDVIIVSDNRPIYYDYGPRFQPVTYYPRQHYRNHYAQPGFYLSISNFDNDWRWKNRKHDRWDNDRWDRDWDRDHDRHKNKRGNGHHKGHGKGHRDRD